MLTSSLFSTYNFYVMCLCLCAPLVYISRILEAHIIDIIDAAHKCNQLHATRCHSHLHCTLLHVSWNLKIC